MGRLPPPLVKNGHVNTPDKLDIIKKHAKRVVPEMPPVDLTTHKALPVLGTLSPDIIRLDATKAKEEKKLIEAAEGLMKELEEKGFGDRYADMQQKSAPKVNDSLVNAKLEVLCEYFEEDGTPFYCWSKCTVNAMPSMDVLTKSQVKKKEKEYAIVVWDKEYCAEGLPDTTLQKLAKNKWNQHTKDAWRFLLDKN